MRSTHTYALLEVSPAVYAEIDAALKKAGYDHAFHDHEGRKVIDMHGIALDCPGDDPTDRKTPAELATMRHRGIEDGNFTDLNSAAGLVAEYLDPNP